MEEFFIIKKSLHLGGKFPTPIEIMVNFLLHFIWISL